MSVRTPVAVHVRLRPVPDAENLPCESHRVSTGIVETEGQLLYLNDVAKEHSSEFVFDRVFNPDAGQEEVFESVGQPLVKHVLSGYNACCFAYGQTGSGKTYTMYGKEGDHWDMRGLIPRCAEQVFAGVRDLEFGGGVKVSVYVSFLEIYLENLRDLGRAAAQLHDLGSQDGGGGRPINVQHRARLSPEARRIVDAFEAEALEILESPAGTAVKDLTYTQARSVADVMAVLRAGYGLRQTAAMAQNDVSSRSHTVFTISVVQGPADGAAPTLTGRLNLVDLAGSERLKKTGSEDLRLREARSINSSLSALGKVVMALTREDATQGTHVPFRDSKLTRVLKDSLAGNSCTTLLACLHPRPAHFEECSNTLQFAVRCTNVMTAPTLNVVSASADADGELHALRRRVAALTDELEVTHAHYQKLLEDVGGADYLENLGPLERAALSREMGRELTLLDVDEAGASGSQHSEASAAPARPWRLQSARSRTGSACSDAGGPLSARGRQSSRSFAATDTRVRTLEAQLQQAKARNDELEGRVTSTKEDYDALVERFLKSSHEASTSAKRASAQVAALKNQLQDSKQEYTVSLRNAKDEAERERDSLKAEHGKLRQQMEALVKSVPALLESRSRSAIEDRQFREGVREEYDRRYREVLASTTQSAQARVGNVVAQSEQFLQQRGAALRAVRDQLHEERRAHAQEVAEWRSENVALWRYLDKLAALTHGMQSGSCKLLDRGAIRRVVVLGKQPPQPLDARALSRLAASTDVLDSYLACSGQVDNIEAWRPRQRSAEGGGDDASPPESAPRPKTGAELAVCESRSREAEMRARVAALEAERDSLAAHAKQAVRAEVAEELKSDETMEYIRQLEGEVRRRREGARADSQRYQGVLAALRAAHRRDAAAAAPGRSIRAASAPLRRPANWASSSLVGLPASGLCRKLPPWTPSGAPQLATQSLVEGCSHGEHVNLGGLGGRPVTSRA